jgi:hypothetical protein
VESRPNCRATLDSTEYWDARGNSITVVLKLAAHPPDLGGNKKYGCDDKKARPGVTKVYFGPTTTECKISNRPAVIACKPERLRQQGPADRPGDAGYARAASFRS